MIITEFDAESPGGLLLAFVMSFKSDSSAGLQPPGLSFMKDQEGLAGQLSGCNSLPTRSPFGYHIDPSC